ncbi:sporulation protein YqfD [Pseudalkalibacillus hwajinpoensis]|uniref:Sporulation protein YqfD n=1 Tax=Guptibacillus hwajinpoensis TaxID=208199 RepID=A0A4U1MII6_9BACL|nr:sporulation protein YqfD [Pseudalkalibacillus hwajinpoensis]TKD70170.1 sporulation protein YqfD [Pseudalkalibacillus hwajinpoensis]
MKEYIRELFSGYVRIKVIGSYTELFINRCIEYKIPIWDIARLDHETIILSLYISDVRRIRPHLKRTRCKVRIHERKGFPFILKRVIYSRGFLTGAISCLLLLFILSNMVWSITVNGATPEVEHKLKQAAVEIGVTKGKFIFQLPSNQELQRQITEKMEEITWVGVKRSGTTYHFEVVQKQLPEKQPALSPRHIVAKKKAIVTKMYVEEGQAQVEENAYVKPGQLLISGFIGKEDKSELVPAKGEVFGRTWYISNVSVPLTSTFLTNTGERKTSYSIGLRHFHIPIWGFLKPEFSEFETVKHKTNLRFLKWDLPLTFQTKKMLGTEEVTRTYSKSEALEAARSVARKDIEDKTSDKAEIKKEKILHHEEENGKVNVKIHFEVIEQIGKDIPIIQGD